MKPSFIASICLATLCLTGFFVHASHTPQIVGLLILVSFAGCIIMNAMGFVLMLTRFKRYRHEDKFKYADIAVILIALALIIPAYLAMMAAGKELLAG